MITIFCRQLHINIYNIHIQSKAILRYHQSCVILILHLSNPFSICISNIQDTEKCNSNQLSNPKTQRISIQRSTYLHSLGSKSNEYHVVFIMSEHEQVSNNYKVLYIQTVSARQTINKLNICLLYCWHYVAINILYY